MVLGDVCHGSGLLAIIGLVITGALVVLGVMDQFSNIRGLRPPLRPRDEEE